MTVQQTINLIRSIVTQAVLTSTATEVVGEVPAGTVNGSNATFTTANDFIPGTTEVYVNGLLQKLVTHYNTSGTQTIIFADSPLSGDIIEVDYKAVILS